MVEKNAMQTKGSEHVIVHARDGKFDMTKLCDGSGGWVRRGLSSLMPTDIFDGESGFMKEYSMFSLRHIWRDTGYIVGATQVGCAAAGTSDGDATALLLLGAIKGREEEVARPMMLYMKEIADMTHMRGCPAEARVIVEATASTVATMDDAHALSAVRLVSNAAHYTKDNVSTFAMVRLIGRRPKTAMRVAGKLNRLAAVSSEREVSEAVTAMAEEEGRKRARNRFLASLVRRGGCVDARDRSAGCTIRKTY